MNRKIVAALFIFAAVGAGAWFLLRSLHGSDKTEAPAGGDNEEVASIVTVQTGKLARATLHDYVEGFGSVAAAPADKDHPAASADVASPVAGVVKTVNVYEGQTVQKGDLLLQLDSRVADVAVEFAEKTVARQQDLLRLKNTSQKAAQDAEQQLAEAKAQQALMRITAPISGTVTRVNARPGEAVDLTTVLASIMDLQRLVINADIPAAEIGEIQTGQTVECQIEPPQEGSVAFIGANVQASNGAVLVRISLSPTNSLRPGQFFPLRIVTATHTNCLAAPEASVIKNLDGKEVIAVVTNDVAVQQDVKTGLRDKGQIEVEAAGLAEGAVVVTVGAYGLPEKTKVRVQNP